MTMPQEQRNFYVIQFLHLPHPSVPQVACVPSSWVRSMNPNDDTVCVSYPTEQHLATEGRILTGETYSQEWPLFMAKLLGGFNSFDEARGFIASQQNSGQQQNVDNEILDEDDEDEEEENPVPQKINQKRVSFSTPRKTTTFNALLNNTMRTVSGVPPTKKAKYQPATQMGSFTNSRPGFYAPQVSHPPKRRLSVSQPSTSAQAMADISTFPDTDNKKIRLKRDLKNISRAFVNIDEQFVDLTNILTRIRASITDMQSVFSSLSSTLSAIVDLDEILQHTSENERKPPTFNPGIIKNFVPSRGTTPQDSKWTLRYRDKQPGVVELMPNSSIYLAEIGLQGAMSSATDAKTLARMLMKEIFSDYALSVCSLAGGKNGVSGRVRPGLDKTARAFLMEFVSQFSRDKGWEVSEHSVLMSLRNKLLEMRRVAQSYPVHP